ncbi:TetR/AcrR family transcriptional regulator [Ktedonospora formicarum]|uniref:TetR family transcriptional regulator n=1 Tax=Ktedonospora formicarum TaxID=2778364 RepID=A0A8J3I7M6_9CHLR|nr:TetR/AcrR family transcriptional regulator [Ktedonospora formicarum]GHO46894.1 TetR family transcriptional regulator [Ktedonospora formicarum]
MMATRAGLDAEAIVQKAAELVDKGGLAPLSMATLASELGVRPPALYHYFAGLAGLRRQLSLLGLQEVSIQVGRAVQGKAGDDAVFALAYALRDFARAHPGLYEAASRAPDSEDREWQMAGQEVVATMIRALSAYQLSDAAARLAVRMLRSVVHGCVSLEYIDGFGLPNVNNETFESLLKALLDYLASHIAKTSV